MGVVRILLALAVIIGHSSPIAGFTPITPGAAVQGFYIISGFYMSMVLSSKYEQNRRGLLLFYENRYLRLIPTYLVVLLLTAVFALAIGRTSYLNISDIRRIGAGMKWPTIVYLVVINLFIVGQDSAMFSAVDDVTGALHFTSDFSQNALASYRFLLVPQAWSIGVELLFYVIAPWLVRARTRTIVLAMAASVALRLSLYSNGFHRDPWTYRFFPCELALFLAGNLAYRAYQQYRPAFGNRSLQRVAYAWTVGSVLLFQIAVLPEAIKYPAFFVLFAMAVPALFEATKNNETDRVVGELSYPVYICHLLVLRFCGRFGSLRGLVCSVASIAFAALLVLVIERPMDRLRQERTRKQRLSIRGGASLPASAPAE